MYFRCLDGSIYIISWNYFNSTSCLSDGVFRNNALDLVDGYYRMNLVVHGSKICNRWWYIRMCK